ncbi:YVTN family beta-propeller repeat-containing protein, partial [Bacillus thuringiensis]|nr:YVTN family beta-propeller repeat-containing protein [Bacillus thuringiensis]
MANAVIATISVGSSPFGVGVNPSTNRIYITNANNNNVSVIDGLTNSVITTIPVRNGPFGVGV